MSKQNLTEAVEEYLDFLDGPAGTSKEIGDALEAVRVAVGRGDPTGPHAEVEEPQIWHPGANIVGTVVVDVPKAEKAGKK